jgi:hypothetical protein
MRTLKMLGPAMLTALALAVCAGSASATTLTSPAGTTLPVGSEIKASNEAAIQVHTKIAKRTCQTSQFTGEVTQKGGASETAAAQLTSLALLECDFTFVVVKPGRLEFHTDAASADGNGIVTWSGGSITTLAHTIVGTVHCLYHTEHTPFGTLTGSKNLGGAPATLKLESLRLIPDKTDGLLCNETEETEEGETVEVGPLLTGSYRFEKPFPLEVD